MSFVLAPLLRVREHKQEQARQTLHSLRVVRIQAEEEARRCHSAWQSFATCRPELERKRFEDVRGRQLTQTELEQYFADVAALRRKEVVLQEEAYAAEKALESASVAEQNAERMYTQAVKNRQKIEELDTIWKAEEHLRREQQEESEREEFSGTIRKNIPQGL